MIRLTARSATAVSCALASTVPSRRTAVGAVTTGRQNTASSLAGAASPAMTVSP
jgi:hypothetical protein